MASPAVIKEVETSCRQVMQLSKWPLKMKGSCGACLLQLQPSLHTCAFLPQSLMRSMSDHTNHGMWLLPPLHGSSFQWLLLLLWRGQQGSLASIQGSPSQLAKAGLSYVLLVPSSTADHGSVIFHQDH